MRASTLPGPLTEGGETLSAGGVSRGFHPGAQRALRRVGRPGAGAWGREPEQPRKDRGVVEFPGPEGAQALDGQGNRGTERGRDW